jgi:hypothetical protein
MNDSQFDDFVNDRLNEYAAPVPAGLWEKVAEGQFDQFIGGKLRDHIAPVPEGAWDKISEGQFDQFVGNKLKDHTAAVPEGMWDKVADGQFDSFIADKIEPAEAPVSAGLWDRIADGQFDSFVAGKVKDHAAPVPAGLWEKIHPEEDDDRVAFWWFRYPAAAVLILALLTAGAWGGYMFFTKKKDNAETSQTNPSKNNTAVPSLTENIPGNNNANAVLPPVAKDEKENAATDHNNNDQPVLDPSANHPKENIAGSKNGLDKSSNSNSINNRQLIVDKTAGSLSNSNHPDEKNTVVRNGNELRLAPPSNKNNGIITNPNDILVSKTGTAVAKNDDNSVSGNNGDDITIEPYQPGFSEAATVSHAKYQLSDLSGKQLSAGNRKFKSVIICPSDKGRNTDWFLETYLSPDIAFKSVSNVSATPLYMLKKDSSEHSRIGYSAGIRLVKPITDNILLKAGIQFTQTNEQYIYRTENEVKTTTVVTVRTIIRAPGDTVIVQDTSVLQTAGYKTNTVKNRYRSFDIPLTVGYQFGDEDLKFGINAGVVVNLTSWYQGMVLDSTYANVPLTKQGNGIYKTNIGLGLIGSVSIVKRLSDDLHVFAEPYFRYNLSDMSTAQSGFKQRLGIGGLALGLRFNLNRK